MAKRTKPSTEDLEALLAKAVSNAEHITDGKLSREREDVTKYYRGELPAPAHKGDSKYVSRDVFDTVDSMRSTVLEAFSAGNRIVFFRPEKGETVQSSKQASEYCRHVFFKENDGEAIMYDTVTDGLMARFSVTKVYKEDQDDEIEYSFEDLTPEELTIKVGSYENYEFIDAAVGEDGLYSGSFKVSNKSKRLVCETIQPEDILVSSGAATLASAKYVIHRTTKSRSYYVKKWGEKAADKLNFTDKGNAFDYEKQSRFDPVGDVVGMDDGYDASVEETTHYEVFIRLDADGSGVSRLWKFDFAGGHILDKEQISRMPFASFVPMPIPHTYYGENFASGVIPIQNARTVLIRQIINHSLITNNPRMQVMKGTLSKPSELLDNRLGGLVNVNRLDGLAPLPQAPLNPFIFNLIGMIDADKEEVTGISSLSQGMNKDAISTQNSQGMVEQLISASQQRTKIISRNFGKYLKELWHLIYHTALEQIDQAEYIAATGNYVEINPAEWKERSAATVELSLGYGEQEAEANKWRELDLAFSQDPQLAPLYTLDKRYEVITRACEKRGIEDIRALLTPPEEAPPPQPNPMEELQVEALRTQIEYQKGQTRAMDMKSQTDRMTAEAALIKAKAEAGYKQGVNMIEADRLEHDKQIDFAEVDLAKNATEQKAVYNPG